MERVRAPKIHSWSGNWRIFEAMIDFIINYDIKYRMGLGGGSAEEDDE